MIISLVICTALVAKLIFLDMFSVVDIDQCSFDRFASPIMYPYLNSLIAHTSFYLTIASIIVLLSSFIYQSLFTYTSFTRIFALLVVPMWYFVIYSLLFGLRDLLGDFSCSSRRHIHANSISGHYAFHIFYIMTMCYLPGFLAKFREESPENPLKYHDIVKQLKNIFGYGTDAHPRYILAAAYIVLFGSSFVTLTRTWLGGYHTLRQILYGIIIALVSHLILNYAFRYTFNRRQTDPFFARVKLLAGLLIIFVIVNLIFHFDHIFGRGHALYTFGELIFLFGGWTALVGLLFASREEDVIVEKRD